MSGDEKYQRYRKRKILRYLIILGAILTIVLEVLALMKKLSFVYGIIPFVLVVICQNYYAKLDYHDKNPKKKV